VVVISLQLPAQFSVQFNRSADWRGRTHLSDCLITLFTEVDSFSLTALFAACILA